MLYEYRRYEVTPGRKPDLDARFTNLTMPLWEKHGIRPLGMFDPEIGTTNELHYLLAWESLAEREQVFRSFLTDPDWVAGRAESEAAGPLTAHIHNQFWRPTPYSPLK
jgi:hypothetical protein